LEREVEPFPKEQKVVAFPPKRIGGHSREGKEKLCGGKSRIFSKRRNVEPLIFFRKGEQPLRGGESGERP